MMNIEVTWKDTGIDLEVEYEIIGESHSATLEDPEEEPGVEILSMFSGEIEITSYKDEFLNVVAEQLATEVL